MSKRVAIIGAGWYGCHIALSLRALGFTVRVFEKADEPLHQASGNNQFRLHCGFHYPRHTATRLQSRDGYHRFIERYAPLTRVVLENIYAVPRHDSLIDFATYRLIMTASGIEFRETDSCAIPLRGIEGLLLTQERVVLLQRSRAYFRAQLGDDLVLGARVASVEQGGDTIRVEGERFDWCVDATWGHLFAPEAAVTYEPTLLLYYECAAPTPALTFVDGPLCAVYPTEDPGIVTLSSVPHTPLGAFATAAEARARVRAFDARLLAEKRAAMEAQVAAYLPDFHERFRFLGPQLSIKTKPVGRYDDRSCSVYRRGRLFSILSGKIDTIFHAASRILSHLEVEEGADEGAESAIRRHSLQTLSSIS